jgi:hypothetical protein
MITLTGPRTLDNIPIAPGSIQTKNCCGRKKEDSARFPAKFFIKTVFYNYAFLCFYTRTAWNGVSTAKN